MGLCSTRSKGQRFEPIFHGNLPISNTDSNLNRYESLVGPPGFEWLAANSESCEDGPLSALFYAFIDSTRLGEVSKGCRGVLEGPLIVSNISIAASTEAVK